MLDGDGAVQLVPLVGAGAVGGQICFGSGPLWLRQESGVWLELIILFQVGDSFIKDG